MEKRDDVTNEAPTHAVKEPAVPMAKAKTLTAAEILAAADIRYEVVDIPEWGGRVRLRTLTGDESVKFTETVEKNKGKSGGAALIISLAAVDDDGKAIFTEDQVKALQAKSLRPLNVLQKVIMKMNGFDEGPAASKND